MTTRDDTLIQTVKTSRPELHHNNSYRSSSASREFTSDYASEVSSNPRKGYETPPSRISTPPTPQVNTAEMTLPERPAATLLSPLTIRHIGPQGTTEVRPSSQLPANLDEMSPPTPGIDDTSYIRFAIEQLSFDEDLVGRGRYSSNIADGGPQGSRAVEQSITAQPPGPVAAPNVPNRRPQSFRFPSGSSRPRTRAQEVLLAIDAPEGSSSQRLGYVPLPLRLPMILLLVSVCLLMVAGLIFSNVYALRNNGLYDYDGYTTPRYFVFHFMPALLGILILSWLHVLQAAIYRSLPYFSMSAELPQDRVLQNMPITAANFVWPDFRFFALGERLVGLTLLILWGMNFTIPLLSTLYQTQYYFGGQPYRWRWTTVQGVGWTLMAMYIILIGALLFCIVRFRKRKSALRSDPKSIADLISIFQRSNILPDFDQSEICEEVQTFIPPRFLRLGYWTPSQTPERFYTVGQQNGLLNRISVQLEAKLASTQPANPSTDSFDIERHRYSQDSAFTRNIHSPFLRYRWCPWYLRDSAVLAWIIAALLLLIAFLVVSFVNEAVRRGFSPLLPSLTNQYGFSSSNFLYRFLPALLGQALFLLWQPIDVFYRAVQPYYNLANPNGTTAQKSLLASYASQPILWVSVVAVRNGDFKLAYLTLISAVAAVIPVLAGGVFSARLFQNGEVRMVASMPGYIALCVMVSVYAVSYLLVWPGRQRYLPHSIDTIAGHLSFLYASPLLNDPYLRDAHSQPEFAARLCGLVSAISPQNSGLDEKSGLTGDGRRRRRIRERYTGRGNTWVDRQLKYAFGIYIGRDGREHLGIDRLQRPGSGEMLVVTGMRRSLSRSIGSRAR